MELSAKNIETWQKDKVFECFSTGELQFFYKGHLISKCNTGIKCSKLPEKNINVIAEITGSADIEEDPMFTFCLNVEAEEDKNLVFTSHKSGLVRAWSGFGLEASETLRCDHKGPISLLLARGPLLVTGSADTTLKVWNFNTRHCEGILRGCTSVPLLLTWASTRDYSKTYIVCGQVDGKLTFWDSEVLQFPVAVADKHKSQVSAITVIQSQNKLVSCARDKLIAFWSLNDFTCLKIMPAFEEIETIIQLSIEQVGWLGGAKLASNNSFTDSAFCLSGGNEGRLRLWNVESMTEVLTESPILKDVMVAPGRKIDLLGSNDDEILVAQDDTVCQYKIKKPKLFSITCANQYEVMEFAIVEPEFLVVATGSPDVKIYNLQNYAVMTGVGHTDAVLAVSACKDGSSSFVSCSKDHQVLLWTIEVQKKGFKANLIARGQGHSSYVGAVGLSGKHIYSASKDGVLKLWKRPESEGIKETSPIEMSTLRTVLAHNQDINSLDVSGDFLATASQDKTCKVWNSHDLTLLQVLNGHRRGVWCCRFSGRSLITTSADCSIKVWSLNHFACLHTLEGHLSSVTSVTVLTDSKNRLATVSSDGLLNLWNVDSNQKLGSFDAHDDKIWAVENWHEKIITGGRDGQIVFWKNVTEMVVAEERQKSEEQVKTDQRLQNYIIRGNLLKALRLCIRLNRPRQTRKMLEMLQRKDQLETALVTLDLDDRNSLFNMVVQWNSIGSFSAIAQEVLKHLLKEALVNNRQLSTEKCLGIISYTEKHFQRLDKLSTRTAIIDLLLQKM